MAFLKLFKNAYTFKAARFKEDDIDPVNPDRGWFHLYTFDVRSEDIKPGLETVVTDPDQSVVLILICIGKKVNDDTVVKIKEIIDHFCNEGKDIVLRVTFDTNGHALEKEPEDIEDVLECAEKIGNLLTGHDKSLSKMLNSVKVTVNTVTPLSARRKGSKYK